MKHAHYKKDVSHIEMIDIYKVLDLFEVNHPCAQHAIKKIMCAGTRGSKDKKQDIKESIDSLERMLEMIEEDAYTKRIDNEICY